MTIDVICLVLFSIVGILISVSDMVKEEISNWLLLALLGVSLLYTFTHLNVKYWYFSFVASLGFLIICFIIFLMSGESLIGGADMKMLVISLVTFQTFSLAYNYLFWYAFYTLGGYIITRLIKKKKVMACGPYYMLALISALFSNFLGFKGYSIYLLSFVIFIITLSSFYYTKRGISYEKTLF